MFKKFKKLCWFLFTACILYYAAVVGLGLSVEPRDADIAVVLGNEVLRNGKPSERLAARVDCAIALYKKGRIKRIMVSGGKGASGYDEATVMKEYLLESNIPESDIIVDSLGINTMATAINTATFMQKEGLKNAIIVTQYFHIPRTQLAFYMAGVQNFSADYPRYAEWRDIPSTLREMVAIPVYWFTK